MGVNLRGIEMLMAQNFLHSFDIHAVLQHQCGGSMAELMGGILLAVQSRSTEVFLYQMMDGRTGNALVSRR